MITPKLDWMIVLKIERKSSIIVPDSTSSVSEMVPFKIVSIGPGKHVNGIFVKTNSKPGDVVFINGPVVETKYEGISYYFAKEEYAVAELNNMKG